MQTLKLKPSILGELKLGLLKITVPTLGVSTIAVSTRTITKDAQKTACAI